MFSLFPITRSHIEYFDSFAAVINSCELLWELERAEKCFLHSLWQNTLTARLFPQCYPLNLTQITAGISLSVSAVISKQDSGRTENTMCWERERRKASSEGRVQQRKEEWELHYITWHQQLSPLQPRVGRQHTIRHNYASTQLSNTKQCFYKCVKKLMK